MNTVKINDKIYTFEEGSSVAIIGNNIVVNGSVINDNNPVCGNTTVVINGNVGDVNTEGSVTVSGSCNNISAGNNVTVGNVSGNIDAKNNVHCTKVGGNISAGNNIIIK